MATDRSSNNPTIIEPRTPLTSPQAASITTASTSNSSGLCQLQSQFSETQIPLQNRAASDTGQTSASATIPSDCHDNNTRSAQQDAAEDDTRTSNQSPKPVPRALDRFSGHGLSNTIGIVSLIGLLFFGVRTYRLELTQAVDSAFQVCISLIQTNITNYETSSPQCQELIDQGPAYPPYPLKKRAVMYAASVGRSVQCAFRTNECWGLQMSLFDRYCSAIVVCATIALGSLLLAFARRTSRGGEPFRSEARSDVQVTQQNQQGIETITGQIVQIIRHNTEQGHHPGELRQRIPYLRPQGETGTEEKAWNPGTSTDEEVWKPINSSTDTLIDPVTERHPSKVSIMNHSANEKYEGLIELETTGDTKSFFDNATGDFIHISPWRSTPSTDKKLGDHHGRKAVAKGGIMRAIARMATGPAVWAGGKEVDHLLVDKITGDEKIRIPQRAGDCLAGEVTNELPSGMPQIV